MYFTSEGVTYFRSGMVRINCTCRTYERIPCNPSSWLASSNLALGLWTLGIAPQRGFHMCLCGFPLWCISLLREWHILGVTWSSLSCRACRRNVHSELLSAEGFKLLSCPRGAHQFSDMRLYGPSMMVLVLALLSPVVVRCWVQPGTLQRPHPVGLRPSSKLALLMH